MSDAVDTTAKDRSESSLTDPIEVSDSDDSCASSCRCGNEPMGGGLLPQEDDEGQDDVRAIKERPDHEVKKSSTKLVATFILFVIVGAAFQVLMKLQAIPMYNYPNPLNIIGCLLYVPLCFLYIIPASMMGVIPEDQLNASKKPFFIMALFDTVSSIVQVFASVYLPGPLLVLLPQASIPISMGLSKIYLRSKYGWWQYAGAIVVILGILVVLEPVMTNRHAPDHVCVAINEERDCALCQAELTEDGCLAYGTSDPTSIGFIEMPFVDHPTQLCRWVESSHETSGTSILLFWSAMLLLSCVPMTLSSIYKEHTLGEMEFDPVYLNGWLCLYQTPLSTLVAIPAGLVASPPVLPQDFPQNMVDGFKCAFGQGTITTGCHPDECANAMMLICIFIVVCFLYTNLMILLLQFGSANIMFLAMTMIVPLGNLAFAMPFMPNPAVLHASDILGLGVIMAGIVSYRFGSTLFCRSNPDDPAGTEDLNEPLLSIQYTDSEHNDGLSGQSNSV